MAGLRLHLPMLHPEHYCSQLRVRGQSDWLSFLCKSLSHSVSSRIIPALSQTPKKPQRDFALLRNALLAVIPIHKFNPHNQAFDHYRNHCEEPPFKIIGNAPPSQN
jgi:hypothetical protein